MERVTKSGSQLSTIPHFLFLIPPLNFLNNSYFTLAALAFECYYWSTGGVRMETSGPVHTKLQISSNT